MLGAMRGEDVDGEGVLVGDVRFVEVDVDQGEVVWQQDVAECVVVRVVTLYQNLGYYLLVIC